jgi:hypothetical protein
VLSIAKIALSLIWSGEFASGLFLAGQNLMAFHSEPSMGTKRSIQMITLQSENDVTAPIYAIRKLKNRFDAVITNCWFAILKWFLDCFHNAAVTKSLRHKIFGFESGRSVLLFGEEWPRFTQERRWAAENYSGIWSKDSPSNSSLPFHLRAKYHNC